MTKHCSRQRKLQSSTTTQANTRDNKAKAGPASPGAKLFDATAEKAKAKAYLEKILKALEDPKSVDKAAKVITSWVNSTPPQKKK